MSDNALICVCVVVAVLGLTTCGSIEKVTDERRHEFDALHPKPPTDWLGRPLQPKHKP